MDPITLLSHRNFLIAFAISPDPRIAGIALYFGILGRYRAPRIGARFPNSSEIWADAKLMLHSDGSPRPLSGPHGRVYNQSIIGYVVVQHFHCQCPTKFELGVGVSFLARALDMIAFASTTEQTKVNCRVGHHLMCQTCSKPMGSWRRLLTSSTQCLLRLWRERYSA